MVMWPNWPDMSIRGEEKIHTKVSHGFLLYNDRYYMGSFHWGIMGETRKESSKVSSELVTT
jgi:hypothetical protein